MRMMPIEDKESPRKSDAALIIEKLLIGNAVLLIIGILAYSFLFALVYLL